MSNLLSEMRPELVSEWSDKNLPLTPDKITYGSNKVVWWKGACGHEWQTSVKARSSGENCPICSGARVIEGINDLATLKPELADEWTSGTEQMEILKVHLCRQRQIKLIKLPYEKQEDKKEYADKVKAVLRRQHIFISTNTEQDIAVIQKRFMEWRKNR